MVVVSFRLGCFAYLDVQREAAAAAPATVMPPSIVPADEGSVGSKTAFMCVVTAWLEGRAQQKHSRALPWVEEPTCVCETKGTHTKKIKIARYKIELNDVPPRRRITHLGPAGRRSNEGNQQQQQNKKRMHETTCSSLAHPPRPHNR